MARTGGTTDQNFSVNNLANYDPGMTSVGIPTATLLTTPPPADPGNPNTGGGPPPPPPDPNAALIAEMRAQALAAEQARQAEIQARRTSAFDEMKAVLAQYGIDPDGTGLSATIRDWVWADKSVAAIKIELRNTKAYNDRFTGMADLIKKGQAISEAEYISQERSYRNVLQQWGLPTGFYDDPTDFGRFIANGVSVKELDDRVRSAKTFLDTAADSTYKTALRDLYGITEGGMLAYVLDGDKAQSALQRQFKEAAFTGAAEKFGFDLNAGQSATYGATLGAQFDSIGADQVQSLEATLSGLGVIAENQQKLAGVDRDTAFTRTDVLEAEVLNDNAKRQAAQTRRQRETARFSGTAAFGQGSLARNTGA